MSLMIDAPKDYGDGLRWWDMAFGAGYPDWLITSPLPPARDGERWVWTGRELVTIPVEMYDEWMNAHSRPVSMRTLQEIIRPWSQGVNVGKMVGAVLKAGLFISWPWGLQDTDDTPKAIALQPNLLTKPKNPLPGVIPDNEWNSVIRMDRLAELWQEARGRGVMPGGLYDGVQDLLRSGIAWLVAQPLPRRRQ